ncbi:MAG: galactofuranose ABC transporter, permease protein YjfF [Planctomycetota bacterium]|jgi:simple sugar transport system permease protein
MILRTRQLAPIAATALVCIALYVVAGLRYDGFFSLSVLSGLFADHAFLGIVAVGMTFVILSGGIDLSVGAVLGCSTIVIAALVQRAGWHPAAAVAAVVALGMLHGAAMGGLIHAFAMPPFIVTLAGMFLARGVGFVVSQEAIAVDHPFMWAVDGLPGSLVRLVGLGDAVAAGVEAHVRVTALVFLATLASGVLAARWTRFGRTVYAVGGNETSARLMGLPVGRAKVGVYAISGGCAALGGAVYVLYTFSGNPTAGTMLELDAIAAVVIGGTLLSGGVGTVAGTLLGVLIFGTIQTAIIFDGSLSSWWTRIAIGLLLLGFIMLQRLMQRALERRPG